MQDCLQVSKLKEAIITFYLLAFLYKPEKHPYNLLLINGKVEKLRSESVKDIKYLKLKTRIFKNNKSAGVGYSS